MFSRHFRSCKVEFNQQISRGPPLILMKKNTLHKVGLVFLDKKPYLILKTQIVLCKVPKILVIGQQALIKVEDKLISQLILLLIPIKTLKLNNKILLRVLKTKEIGCQEVSAKFPMFRKKPEPSIQTTIPKNCFRQNCNLAHLLS